MHMADALVTPAVAGTMYACSHSAVMCGTWHFMAALSEH